MSASRLFTVLVASALVLSGVQAETHEVVFTNKYAPYSLGVPLRIYFGAQ